MLHICSPGVLSVHTVGSPGGLGGWEDGRRGGGEDGRMGVWEEGRMGGWEEGRMGVWEEGRMGGGEDGGMGGGEDGRMGGGEDGGMGRGEDGRRGGWGYGRMAQSQHISKGGPALPVQTVRKCLSFKEPVESGDEERARPEPAARHREGTDSFHLRKRMELAFTGALLLFAAAVATMQQQAPLPRALRFPSHLPLSVHMCRFTTAALNEYTNYFFTFDPLQMKCSTSSYHRGPPWTLLHTTSLVPPDVGNMYGDLEETQERFPKLGQMEVWDELGSGEAEEGSTTDCDDEDGCEASGDGQDQTSLRASSVDYIGSAPQPTAACCGLPRENTCMERGVEIKGGVQQIGVKERTPGQKFETLKELREKSAGQRRLGEEGTRGSEAALLDRKMVWFADECGRRFPSIPGLCHIDWWRSRSSQGPFRPFRPFVPLEQTQSGHP
ncbi:hypothetical protein EYF80_042219 [Liparis tanakae]|uniref:Uncharacterized protein n=1 Tax=Liparis tanakae TaxID=230148 RepID=A0A4Z2G244_9TELE|nr:hypothetical protein EYF80_042219 [Liparis tanakae]